MEGWSMTSMLQGYQERSAADELFSGLNVT